VTNLLTITGNHEEQRRLGYDGFSCGWAIGTQQRRRELAREHAHLALTPGLAADEARVLREARWRVVPGQQLQSAGRTQEQAQASAKTAPWKLRLAQRVRDECGAAITWLARELDLGAEGTARSLLSKLRRAEKQQYSALTPFLGRLRSYRAGDGHHKHQARIVSRRMDPCHPSSSRSRVVKLIS